MESNIDKSRSALNKFGIQKYSEIVQPLLERHNVDGHVLFFEFVHSANQLKCRLAFLVYFSNEFQKDYETYLTFDFTTNNPIEVEYHGSWGGRNITNTGFRTVEYLWGLEELDVDILVDSLLQKR